MMHRNSKRNGGRDFGGKNWQTKDTKRVPLACSQWQEKSPETGEC